MWRRRSKLSRRSRRGVAPAARCTEGIVGRAKGGVEVLSVVARRIDSRRSPRRCHAGGQVRRIKGIGGSVEWGLRELKAWEQGSEEARGSRLGSRLEAGGMGRSCGWAAVPRGV
jgi:hypothetical protein